MPTIITPDNSIVIGDVRVLDMGTEECFAQFDTSARRKMACAWGDRGKLINALNPQGTSVGGVYVFSSIPYPDFPNLYPQKFTTKGEGKAKVGPNGMVGYDYAIVTAEYAPFRGGDAQGYLEFDLCANVITMPGSGTWLETDELQEYTNPDGSSGGTRRLDVPLQDCARGYPLTVIGIVRGRSNVAGLNVGSISSVAKAPLNSTTFMGFPPGTVMFQGARARRQTLTNVGTGASASNPNLGFVTPAQLEARLLDGAWDIECRFQARPGLAWDVLPFRQKIGDAFKFIFKKVRLKNDQGPYIGRSDLNALFA